MEPDDPSRERARPGPRPSMGRWVAAIFTLGCVGLAFHLRSLNAAGVFDGDPLHLSGIDAYGYMRRAWLALAHWPRVALFDTAIGFPRGLPVLSDIGFDFILATIARAIGGADPSRRAAETICAWAIPALGALAPAGACLLGARIANRAAAMASALLVAVVPTLVYGSQVGLIDQNAIEAPLALLALAVAWDAGFPPGGRARRAALAGALLAGAILVWGGFVLVAGILALWAAAQRVADALARRPAPALAEGVGATLVLAAAILLAAEAIFLGRKSLGIEFERLSLFQPLALAGGGAGLLAIAFLFPRDGAPRRPMAAAAGFALSGALLVLAARGLFSGLAYVSGGPVPGGATMEGRSFRQFGIPGLLNSFGPGAVAYAIGVAAIALRAIRDRLARPGDTLLLVWTAATALLARGQYPRYAPHLALPLALALGSAAGSLFAARRRRALAMILGIALVAVAAVPPLRLYRPTKVHSVALFHEPAREVLLWARAHTPPAGIARSASARPPYGVLAPWRYGYWIVWLAERPVVGSPLLLRPEERLANARGEALLLSDGATAAGRIEAERLRYVLATPMIVYADTSRVPHRGDGVPLPTAAYRRALNTRLLHDDGSDAGENLPCLGNFRLLQESHESFYLATAGPDPLPGAPVAAVKLFERVRGARITGRARPGSAVTASIRLRTPVGRDLDFACAARAGADGRFRILVPYRTSGANGDGGTRALGAWEVRRDGAVAQVEVTERDVLGGGEKAIR